MTVLVSVAVPREVLSAGLYSLTFEPLSPGERVANNRVGIVAKRPIADDGIRWVRVDIEDRREVQIESEAAQLTSRERARRSCACKVILLGQQAGRGHGGDLRAVRRLQSLNSSPFLIDGHQGCRSIRGPQPSKLTQQARALSGRGQVAPKQHDAARRPLGDIVSKLVRDVFALEADHHDGGGQGLGAVELGCQGAPPSRMIVFRIISESEAPGLSFRYILYALMAPAVFPFFMCKEPIWRHALA